MTSSALREGREKDQEPGRSLLPPPAAVLAKLSLFAGKKHYSGDQNLFLVCIFWHLRLYTTLCCHSASTRGRLLLNSVLLETEKRWISMFPWLKQSYWYFQSCSLPPQMSPTEEDFLFCPCYTIPSRCVGERCAAQRVAQCGTLCTCLCCLAPSSKCQTCGRRWVWKRWIVLVLLRGKTCQQ